MNKLHADCESKLIHSFLLFSIVLDVNMFLKLHHVQYIFTYSSRCNCITNSELELHQRSTSQSHHSERWTYWTRWFHQLTGSHLSTSRGKYLSLETQGRRLSRTCWQAHGRGGGVPGGALQRQIFKKLSWLKTYQKQWRGEDAEAESDVVAWSHTASAVLSLLTRLIWKLLPDLFICLSSGSKSWIRLIKGVFLCIFYIVHV